MSLLGRIRWNSVLSSAGILWSTWRSGELVGTDALGNRYYRGPKRSNLSRERRWVIYAAEPEATLVPAAWHGWLHYTTDVVPAEGATPFHQPWMKPHEPNLTGTALAYRPPGHMLKGGRRPTATGDYEAWSPE